LGRICLDILKDKWSALLQITSIGLSLSSLLCNPNLSDPLDTRIADHFKMNLDDAHKFASNITQKYALEIQDLGVDLNDFV